ncbi:hypothetical protein ZIOFF_000464 [Zingiber officinale]|uniref:FLZ-type domain-containing protein n=1 Tax=Zingiber officinale TaxID=94328 RepID=A0A8J5I4K4_ZINOF|nr:hypothetical protein ZIOFF_000464 [Zingiber officinale]
MYSPSRSTLAIFLSLSSYNLFTPSCRPIARLYWIFLHDGVNKNPPPLMQNPIANSPTKPKTFGDSQSSSCLLQEHRTQCQAADVDPTEGAPRKVLVGGEIVSANWIEAEYHSGGVASPGSGVGGRGRRRISNNFVVTETAPFLMACGLCKRCLGSGRDTFMYRRAADGDEHEGGALKLKLSVFRDGGGGRGGAELLGRVRVHVLHSEEATSPE